MKARFVLRAADDVLDSRVVDLEGAQLPSYRNAKVDHVGPGRIRCHDLHPGTRGGNRVGDVVADFEAATTDAGTDRRDDRPSAETLKARAHDARDDTAPSRVNRGDVAGCEVAEEHGHAVGDPNAHGEHGVSGFSPLRAPDYRVGLFAFGLCPLDCTSPVHLHGAGDPNGTERLHEFAIVAASFRECVPEPCVVQQLRLQQRHADR